MELSPFENRLIETLASRLVLNLRAASKHFHQFVSVEFEMDSNQTAFAADLQSAVGFERLSLELMSVAAELKQFAGYQTRFVTVAEQSLLEQIYFQGADFECPTESLAIESLQKHFQRLAAAAVEKVESRAAKAIRKFLALLQELLAEMVQKATIQK